MSHANDMNSSLDSVPEGSYYLGSWLFFRMLAAVYFIAFFSAGMQLEGLYGSNGILPMDFYIATLKFRGLSWQDAPGVFWWIHTDEAIRLVPLLGVCASFFLMAGILQPLALIVLWVLYLSIVSVGTVFFAFQWDMLLLEMGFLAILFSPQRLRSIPGKDPAPSPYVRWGLLYLLFRVMFFSGYVKLASQDPSWRNLSALQYHYETQPLPNPLSWWFHQLPNWWHTIEALGMFFIELLVPFLLFCGARVRNYAAGLLAFLQLLIMLSGNYCFFNLQVLTLIVLVVEDRCWLRMLSAKRKRDGIALVSQWNKLYQRSRIPEWVYASIISLLVLLSAREIDKKNRYLSYLPYLEELSEAVKPYHLVNAYGVFAVMTTSRHEVVLEGTLDGKTWKPYTLLWQPGPVDRMPGQIAPFQARLDWRMWFVPFSSCRQNRWLPGVFDGLLRNLPPVISLFAENPFPEQPPRVLRAMIYRYQFTSWSESSRAWWKRDEGQLFCPPMGLKTPCEEEQCLRSDAAEL